MPSTVRGSDNFDSNIHQGLGFNQTWQDVTSNRAIGSPEVNNKPYPIEVSVSAVCATGNTNLTATVGLVTLSGNMTTNLANIRASISFTVPAYESYTVGTNNGSVTSSLQWGELK